MNFAGVMDVLVGVNRRIWILLVAAFFLAGCASDAGSDFETTQQTSTSTLGDTTTSTVGISTSTSLVVGPAQLELGGYSYFIEISGLGESNVYLTPNVDPGKAAAVESTEFHADLGDGVKLWVGDREGRPFFMTVESAGDWVTLVHVGWETPPHSDFLLSLAGRLRGEASNRGVVIPDFDV